MISWAPFSDKALDFLASSDARLNILHGSVRSSKTINCTVRWIDFMLSGPPGDLAMLGKTTATLQRNVLNDLLEIVGTQNYKWVNRQQGELRIFHRRVYLFGANNEDAESKLRGATFAGAYCDEVTLYPQSVFNQLMARLSVPGAQCFCNTNPDSPYHWFYTDYIQNEDITDKLIWHFTMDDNLSLDADYVRALKQEYRGVWYERMIEGKWVVAEGRVYDMFEPKEHMVDTAARLKDTNPKAIRYIAACDYGTSNVMSWGLYAVLPNGKYLKVKEYYYNAVKIGVQRTDSQFADDFKPWLDGIVPWAVYCDPSAASWKLELSLRGYKVLNADNDVINGIRHVGKMLATGDYVMDLTCVNTEAEYMTYSWDATAQRLGVDKPLKVNDHACDTDRYALYTDSKYGRSGVY